MISIGRWIRLARGIVAVGVVVVLPIASCVPAISPSVDAVTQSFDNAIAALGSQSGQWQATLQGLENNLFQQGQTTLANQVQSVIARGVATTSSEFRCDATFLASELSASLQDLLAHFHGESPPPPPPHFCNVDPSVVDLRLAPGQRSATLNVYGFNFTSSNINVAVVDQSGGRRVPPPGVFAVPTEFLATFNIVNYPFGSSDRYVNFALPAGEERTIGIDQAPTCGGIGQPCCTVGSACVASTGCMAGTCAACPTPAGPLLTKTIFTKSNEFAGNNGGGQDVDRTYGGACDNGFHHEQCSVAIVDSCDVCTAQGHLVNSSASDCSCVVHFHTPADFTKGIHVNITISETQNAVPRPAGCP